MNVHTQKIPENSSKAVANEVSRGEETRESTFQFVDNRPEAAEQRQFQKMLKGASQQQLSPLLSPVQRQAIPSNPVVQREGNVNRTQVAGVDSSGTTEVAIGQWLPTTGAVLSSSGYGGCMAVVVNDPTRNVGALAHVFDAPVRGAEAQAPGGGITAVNTIVLEMIASTGRTVDQLECLIWAGVGINGTIAVAGPDHSAGLSAMAWLKFVDHSQRDTSIQGYGSAIRYDPSSASCLTGSPLFVAPEVDAEEGPLEVPDYGAIGDGQEEDLFAGLTVVGEEPEAEVADDLFAGMTIVGQEPEAEEEDMFAGMTMVDQQPEPDGVGMFAGLTMAKRKPDSDGDH